MSQEEVDKDLQENSDQGAGSNVGEEPQSTDFDFAAEFATENRPRKTSGSKLLLILLVVVGFGAAGFYLLGQIIFPTDTQFEPVAAEKTSKIKVPERSAPLPAEGVTEEVVSAEKIVSADSKPEVTREEGQSLSEPQPRLQLEPVAAVVDKPFSLKSGQYLYEGDLKKAVRQIKQRGYEVSQDSSLEKHKMTRLLAGRYERPLAEKRLAEVKLIADGAFLVADNGLFAVYAGSFLSTDKARRLADLLFQGGVRTEEVEVAVDLPRTTLNFGNFATRDEALRVAADLKRNGVIAPEVVQNP